MSFFNKAKKKYKKETQCPDNNIRQIDLHLQLPSCNIRAAPSVSVACREAIINAILLISNNGNWMQYDVNGQIRVLEKILRTALNGNSVFIFNNGGNIDWGTEETDDTIQLKIHKPHCIFELEKRHNEIMAALCGGALTSPNSAGYISFEKIGISAEREDDILTSWGEVLRGERVGYLTGSSKYVPIPMSNPPENSIIVIREIDCQICRAWGVPPSIIGITSDQNLSNLEAQQKQFYTSKIMPMLRIIESAMKMIQPNFKFNLSSSADLANAYALDLSKLINGAMITPNEAREILGLSSQKGGNELFVNSSLIKITQTWGGGVSGIDNNNN